MSIIIGFLTAILVLNCIFLILLILIQLPKKEAGAGVAFGGGATEALFGAGSGNVLTKVTKYSAGLFMGMALLLSVLNAQHARSTNQSLELELQRASAATNQPAPASTQAASTEPAATPPLAAPVLQSTLTNIAPSDAPVPANPDAPVEQP
jgi:preprotein translocase subunit SecG